MRKERKEPMKDEPTQGVAGTQRHDFDVDVVRERLPWADSEQLRRMLDPYGIKAAS